MKKNKSVLITGGSSGIGFELSRLFARDGYDIYWVSLNKNELIESKSKLQSEYPYCSIQSLTKDLSKASAPKEVFEWAETDKAIDILVNNAGFGTYGFAQEIDMAREIDMIKLNVLAVFQLTRFFLATMTKRDSGKIMNISSGTAFQPVPRMATYSATKAFVKQLTESIQYELEYRKSNVQMTLVCPAAISDTNFKTDGDMADVNTFDGLVTTTAKEVAGDAYAGLMAGKKMVVSGKRFRTVHKFSGIIPNTLQQYLLRKELDRGS